MFPTPFGLVRGPGPFVAFWTDIVQWTGVSVLWTRVSMLCHPRGPGDYRPSRPGIPDPVLGWLLPRTNVGPAQLIA
ncbi:hypothetical protein CTI12_AA137850 [Artemisia annua]|uniref:Uncharacterized protein n=1 Tax=Artemisia annua TaxID=35608 RepID=A0A2U1NKM8_ARTAN|nr:hypothetical protein CTI12_AA137850 [Artemisia annua]